MGLEACSASTMAGLLGAVTVAEHRGLNPSKTLGGNENLGSKICLDDEKREWEMRLEERERVRNVRPAPPISPSLQI